MISPICPIDSDRFPVSLVSNSTGWRLAAKEAGICPEEPVGKFSPKNDGSVVRADALVSVRNATPSSTTFGQSALGRGRVSE